MHIRAKKFTIIAAAMYISAAPFVRADPVVDFFHRLGDSIARAGKKQPGPRRTTAKTTGKKPGATPAPGDQNSPPADAAMSPSATPTAISSTPTPVVVKRAGTVASPMRRDLPYAVPVPNRPGFVASPYAPGQGLVDIRGIPPGTEVQDPFTGKSFLTP